MERNKKWYYAIVSFVVLVVLLITIGLSIPKGRDDSKGSGGSINDGSSSTGDSKLTTDDIDKLIEYAVVLCDVDGESQSFYDNATNKMMSFNELIDRQFKIMGGYIAYCFNAIYGNGATGGSCTVDGFNFHIDDNKILLADTSVDSAIDELLLQIEYSTGNVTDTNTYIQTGAINFNVDYLFRKAISGGYQYDDSTHMFVDNDNPTGVAWSKTGLDSDSVANMLSTLLTNNDYNTRNYLGFSPRDVQLIIEMIQNQIIGSSAWSSGINAIDNANYRAYEVIVPRVVANALYLMQDGTYSLDCKNDDNYKILPRILRVVGEKIKASKLSSIDWNNTDSSDAIDNIAGEYKRYRSFMLVPKLDSELASTYNTNDFDIDYIITAIQGSSGVDADLKLNLRVFTDKLVCDQTMVYENLNLIKDKTDRYSDDGTIKIRGDKFDANFDYMDFNIPKMIKKYCEDNNITGKTKLSNYEGVSIDDSFYTADDNKTYINVYNQLFDITFDGEIMSSTINATANYIMIDFNYESITNDNSGLNPLIKIDFLPATN